jgi:hypothetical protein
MRIAVVGNADIKTENGSLIDSCDFVFRFNRAVVSGYEKHKGKKTTHMGIVNEGHIAMNHTLQKVDRRVVKNADEIWFPRPKVNREYEKKLSRVCNKTFKFMYCREDWYVELYRLIGCNEYKDYACQPSTGITIIYMIMKMIDYDELLVTGFDGFKTVHYWENRKRTEEVKYHNGNNEWLWLMKMNYKNKLVLI